LRVEHDDARRDRLEDLVGLPLDAGELGEALREIVVETRVVDGDRGLVGDRREQRLARLREL